MAKISKEEIRKRLQQKEKKDKSSGRDKRKEKKPDKQKKDQKESVLLKDLKRLGIVSLSILILLAGAIVLKEKTGYLNQSADFLINLLNIS